MLSTTFVTAFSGAALLQAVLAGDTTNTQLISSPTAQPTNLRSLKYAGCFKSAAPMINHGPYTYQSSGNCQKICYLLQNSAMALGNGLDCWCGDMLPATSYKVDDSQCSTVCAGYDKEKCGGADVFTIYSTGYTLNEVPHAEAAQADSSSSAAAGSSGSASASVVPKTGSGGGGSSVGIAVGVVVGILVLAALCGAAFLYFRRRQQKQMEEYKKQVDAPSFFGANKDVSETRPSMWAPDNRLNGAGAHRNSVGSIADNQDYSRKILQVRNPDGF